MLTHIICPVDHSLYTLHACKHCARHWTKREDYYTGTWRHCTLPYAAIAAITHEGQQRVGVGISVTQLAHCWRQAWAEGHIAYATYPHSRWSAHHGTAIHEYLERHMDPPQDECLSETRYWKRLTFTKQVEGIEISGQIDNWWPSLGIITDYKAKVEVFNSSAFAEDLRHQYQLQLQIYQWMLEDGCEIRDADGAVVPIQAPVPITRLILYPVDHQTFGMVECPLGDTAAIREWVHAGAQALAQGELAQVPRRFAEPATEGFCKHVCVFQERCAAAGGTVMPHQP